jgi:environmental stress-induced protein Ves
MAAPMASPRYTLLEERDFRRTPWKNGLGFTDQIAIHPETADLRRGDFDWRVSTASIAQSSDFSPFPEHDRVLVVLQGAGLRLTHQFDPESDAEVVELRTSEIHEFPGDIPSRCELLSGPIRDFSVFLRQGVVSGFVDWVEFGEDGTSEWQPEGETCFLHVLEGTLQSRAGAVSAGQVLRVDFPSDVSPEIVPLQSSGARILRVQIRRE